MCVLDVQRDEVYKRCLMDLELPTADHLSNLRDKRSVAPLRLSSSLIAAII